MSMELWSKIFAEVGHTLEKAYLWNYGEPLLNPQITTMLESVRGSSVKKIVSTTGSTLERFPDLRFMTALDEVIISINGFTNDTYALHQKNGDLETVKRGVRRLATVLADSQTDFVLQTVAHAHNLEQLALADTFARGYGFKRVVIKSFNVMDNHVQTFAQFVPVGTAFSRYDSNARRRSDLAPKREPCLDWMVINWNGDVNPCCWDYEGKYVLGNVAQQGVLGTWTSQPMIAHRNAISAKQYLDICANCMGDTALKKWSV